DLSAIQQATGPCARQALTGAVLGGAGGFLISDAASSNGRVKAAGTLGGAAIGGLAGVAVCQRAQRQKAELEARFEALERSNDALRRRVTIAEARSDREASGGTPTPIGQAPPRVNVPGGGIGDYVEIGDVEVLANRVVRFPIGGRLAFRSGSSAPSPQMNLILNELAMSLLESPNSVVQIQGHTDSEGSDASNMRLSVARAEAVASYLAARGVPRARIEAIGLGESVPIDTNETDAGRQRNRRIEVLIAPTS
ncbi:MAG: OmpA family protein, partial [Bacteroidota bacterium]